MSHVKALGASLHLGELIERALEEGLLYICMRYTHCLEQSWISVNRRREGTTSYGKGVVDQLGFTIRTSRVGH